MNVLYVVNPKIPYSQTHRLGDFSFTRSLIKSMKPYPEIRTFIIMNTLHVTEEEIESFEQEYGAKIISLPEDFVSNMSTQYNAPYFKYIVEACKDYEIDLVHFNQAQPSAIHSIKKFIEDTSIPSVFTFHTPPEVRSVYISLDDYKVLTNSPKFRLVSVSNSMKHRWLDILGEGEYDSLVTVCNGSDVTIDHIVPLKERNYLCSVVGRIDPLKNSLVMVDLLRKMWKATGQKSVFIGDTFDANYSQNDTYILDTVNSLKEAVAEGSIDWIKSIPHNEVYDYLGHSKFYMNLSEVETFSLTTCEAMIAGTPAIGFNKNGVGELITSSQYGKAVTKIPRKRYSFYYDEILNYVSNEIVEDSERSKLSDFAIENYSSTTMAKGYVRLYEDMLGGN